MTRDETGGTRSFLGPRTSLLVARDLASSAEGASCECGVFRYQATLTSALLPVLDFVFVPGQSLPPTAGLSSSQIKRGAQLSGIGVLGTTAVMISFVAASAHAQAPTAKPNQKELRESLLAADKAVSTAALKGGIKTALAEAMAPDVFLLYEGAPIISGRTNAAALLEAQVSLSTLRVQRLPLVVATSTDGTIGATWGVTAITDETTKPGATSRFGKYISTWRRTQQGAWQLAANIDLGLASGELVIPPNVAPVSKTSPTPLSGSGAPFAKADVDFAHTAEASGAPAAFGAFAASDAMTLAASGEIVVGPAAIKSRMIESPLATAKWEWHPVYSEGAVSGDLGFTIGEAAIAPIGASAASTYRSKYLTVWRRQADGTIRFIVDAGNGR